MYEIDNLHVFIIYIRLKAFDYVEGGGGGRARDRE